ncbi:MAG: hypothetical protein U5L45_01330 [Saprospiraceae bacterium]|nr:hypothetical protein [Saprospiraceae bacterium]
MVHFSGKARKMNHLSSFYASEASAKMPFNAYFEFMYGFKLWYKNAEPRRVKSNGASRFCLKFGQSPNFKQKTARSEKTPHAAEGGAF